MPPHDPPVSAPLLDRTVATNTGRRLFCPRPVVRLPIRSARGGGCDLDVPFVVDTGSDVTMIPANWASHCRIVGYDPAAVVTPTGTSFHGQLSGRWGQIGTRIGSRPLDLPCFFFIDLLPRSGWFGPWFTRFFRRDAGLDYGPFVLGRAGLFPSFSLLIEHGRVALSGQPFR